MYRVLICAQHSLEAELSHTLLWRQDMQRLQVSGVDEALAAAREGRPSLAVVDRDLPWAERMVTALRREAVMRGVAIIIMARGGTTPSEVDLSEAGADAVLRVPATVQWDDQITQLMSLPVRGFTRFGVQLRIEAMIADDPITATALNLSEGGMLIETPLALEIDWQIEFAFSLPGRATLISGRARVVHEAAPTRFGLQFIVLDPEEKEAIRLFVESLAASS
ncbi:MAG: PilZ domain-containing protein [Vicinamibacteria bacterium]|jgi:hypothetical protein|nr:PilZ domain-containing protein [Vicinamibacteria bacterium]